MANKLFQQLFLNGCGRHRFVGFQPQTFSNVAQDFTVQLAVAADLVGDAIAAKVLKLAGDQLPVATVLLRMALHRHIQLIVQQRARQATFAFFIVGHQQS